MDHAYFHVTRELESLKSVATRLYGNTETPTAQDFLRFNSAVAVDGYVWPGNLLFLPERMCYAPEVEAQVIETIKVANGDSLKEMTMPERQFLATNHTLVNNTAKSAPLLDSGFSVANTAVSGLFGALSLNSRIMGDSLKNLQTRYVEEFRKNGKLTQHFFIERQRAYRTLDTALGRISRTLTMGTPIDMTAKSALDINIKSQILHWKRHGTEQGVKGFQKHFATMQRHARFFKTGGFLTTGIDGFFTYDAIVKACQSKNDRECRKAAVVEGSAFGGRVGGGLAGGAIAYTTCNAFLAAPTVGTSLLWCGIVAGAAGGVAGGMGGGWFLGSAGDVLFETAYPAR